MSEDQDMMKDIPRAGHCQVQIDGDGHRVWVNVDGLCVCRVWAREVVVDNHMLQRCPFCGSRRIIHCITGNMMANLAYMCCDDCGAQGPTTETDAGAKEAWNARNG